MAGVTPFPKSPGWAIRAREASREALEGFEPESPEPKSPERESLPSAITTASERPPVSLAALKAAGIQFRGEEAVAVGQALCRALMTAQLLRRIIPDLDTAGVSSPVTAETVFIDAASRVGVTVDDPRDVPAAIQSVGRILSDILPANIRLILDTPIIEKALASPPQFGTLDELSQALAAYEEFNGRELIQAVYERWEKLELPRPAVATATAPDRTPTLSPPDPGPAASLRSGYHPIAVAALTLAAIAIMGLSAWFLMSRSEADVVVEIAPLLEARPIALPTGTNFPELMPAVVAETAGLAASLNPAVLPLSVARAERPAPPPLVARIERPAVFAPPPSVIRAEPPLLSVIRSNDEGAIAIDRAAPEPGKDAAARSRFVSGRWPMPIDTPLTTYGAKDADVTPPIPILPRLLAGLQPSSPGVRLDALTMAVVVNEDGTAYSVTAVNAPENMGEYVLLTTALAVVKSWKFSPAMRDSAPVRYRLIVPLRAVTRPEP